MYEGRDTGSTCGNCNAAITQIQWGRDKQGRRLEILACKCQSLLVREPTGDEPAGLSNNVLRSSEE